MVIARFEGHDPERRDLSVELRYDDEPVTLISAGGRVHLVPGGSADADITIAGPLEGVVGLLLGRLDPAEAAERGVTHTGDVRRLRALRPRGERPQALSMR
jgi:hypothetical protein